MSAGGILPPSPRKIGSPPEDIFPERKPHAEAGKAADRRAVFWMYGTSPFLAVILTMIAGGIMFWMRWARTPFEAIRTIFWDPLFNPDFASYYLRGAAAGQGRHR